MKLTLFKEKVNLEEDIKNRNDYIGGSDIGVIMGCNPWKSAYTLWAEKTGLIEPDNLDDVESVWWGQQEEELVAKRFTMKTGLKVKKANFAFQCKEYPYLRGHIDRIASKGKWGIECKTTSYLNRTDYDSGDVPPMHYWQCMFYMCLTGADHWYLCTKRNNNEFHIIQIDRDEEVIQQMIDACESFWKHVTDGTPPEVDGSSSTTETLKEVYSIEASEPFTVDLSAAESEIVAIGVIKDKLRETETIKKKYENTIKALMQEHTYGESENYIVTWKADSRGARILRIKAKENEKENV